MAGELNVQAVMARPQVPVLPTEQLVYVLLELRPAEGVVTASLPLNLSMVLDRSGSMKGSKIEALRDATAELMELLGPQDSLSVIIFNNKYKVLLQSQAVTEDRKGSLQGEIRGIKADGGTNMAPAMEAAIIELRRRMPLAGGNLPANDASSGQVNRMVLLTDGITEREKRCLSQAGDAAHLGIPIVALGIGRDWNDKLLQTIAEQTGGVADYVRDPEEIKRHFQRTVQQMQQVALTNARTTVRTSMGVRLRTAWRVYPLIGKLAQPMTDGSAEQRITDIALGEIERGKGQSLLLELLVPSRPAGSYRIAQIETSYDVPGNRLTGQLARTEVLLTYSAEPGVENMFDPTVMNVVEKVTAYKLQTGALDDLEVGNVQAATSKLQSAVTRLLNQGDLELAQTVQQELDNLEKGRAMTSEGRKTIRFGSGKTVRLDK